ncbi:ATP-binding protein [Gordonia sp. (in: high G+C Gram-positive bacteria)]|uniref:sensor histidine kinase n=1 Tax=Gordonia sp. (in: high G+C Gram-positive bacteria) TaxID=84139 RepID=UPI0016BB431F|nr:ATP-binding protein [Gordonia sp. (in: high G+C Gram-positive bacteria)]NLG48306.1 ATP-binding protein [Gordonia sp. (in: high G+C Gram-positive bacteria)]
MPQRQRTTPILTRIQLAGIGVLGLTYLGIFFVSPTGLARIASFAAPWWSWLGGAVIIASATAYLAVAVLRRPDWLAPVGYLAAAAYLAVLGTWFLAWDGSTAPNSSGARLEMWVIFIPQVGSYILVLAGRLGHALINVVIAGGLGLAVAGTAAGQFEWVEVVQAFWLLAVTCLYQVIAWAVVTGAKRFDDEQAAQERHEQERRLRGARDAEQRRVDAMVHDRLIAVLLALRPGELSSGLANGIDNVLGELEDLRNEASDWGVRTSAPELARRLRLSVEELGDGIDLSVNVSSRSDYPAAVAEGVIDSVSEAVRNFRRHAGPAADCAVVCDIGDDAISAIVMDDGVGFDPEEIPANRIGVALGILDRMHVLDGGRSRVESRPGVGTRVEMVWNRPEDDS